MRLFLAIALGIAFGVAFIPAARWIVARAGRLVAKGHAWRPPRRARVGMAGAFAAIVVLWIAVREAETNDAAKKARVPVYSSAAYASAARAAGDSVEACSDSAALVQRQVNDLIWRRYVKDQYEPRGVSDSAYLAWRHRRARSDAGETVSEIYAGWKSCNDFRSRQ